MEKINDEETVDLLIAALFHDVGFIKAYNGNEIFSAEIARAWLEKEGHPEARIIRVEELILATVPFTTPKNLLEKIIQDADLDNF